MMLYVMIAFPTGPKTTLITSECTLHVRMRKRTRSAMKQNGEYFHGANSNAAHSVPVVDEFDLSEFAVELEAVVGAASASDSGVEAGYDDDEATAHNADPPGMYPSYRSAEADAMAEEASEDETERPRAPRSRYIDDEAEDDGEAEFH